MTLGAAPGDGIGVTTRRRPPRPGARVRDRGRGRRQPPLSRRAGRLRPGRRDGQGRPLAGHGRRPRRAGARQPRCSPTRFPADGLMGEEDAAPLRASAGAGRRGPRARAASTVPACRSRRSSRRSTAATTRAVRGGAGGRSTRSTARRASCATSSTRSRSRSSRTARSCSRSWARPNLPLAGAPGDAGPAGACSSPSAGAGPRQLSLDRVLGGEAAPAEGTPIAVAPIADAREARYAESVEAAHSSQSVSARIARPPRDHGGAAAPRQPDEVRGRGARRRLDLPALRARRLPRERLGPRRGGAHRDRGGRAGQRRRSAGRSTSPGVAGSNANRGIVAAAGSIHRQVLDAVAAVLG